MRSVRASTLIPRGFVADDAINDLDGTLITMRPGGVTEYTATLPPEFAGKGLVIDEKDPRFLAAKVPRVSLGAALRLFCF